MKKFSTVITCIALKYGLGRTENGGAIKKVGSFSIGNHRKSVFAREPSDTEGIETLFFSSSSSSVKVMT